MKIRLTILLVSSICCIAIFTSCDPEKPEAVVCGSQDLTNIPYVPEEYVLNVPDGFPPVVPTPGNPLTKDGVTLGRFLFYDPILSGDSTQSCSSCHAPQHAFSDPFPVSVGIDGIPGKRNAMALMNLAMHFNGFVWDGSSETLEEQALEPVNNTLELHGDWAEIEVKLRSHPSYPARFRKAFGISTTAEIDRELVAMALAQFQRILISSGDSKHDRFIRGEYTHTPSEERGFRMFFDGDSVLPEAECGHCHSLGLFTTNEYMNNGLDSANDLTQFPDPGRGAITNVIFDNGRFKVPTIRNLIFTAPYMHDGRFTTIEQVMDHYESHGKPSLNKDPLIDQIDVLTPSQRQDIINFMLTLTDSTFVQNPEFQDPFQ